MSKKLFLEINDQSGPQLKYVGSGLCTWAKACVRRHIPVYTARVLEAWKMQVFYNNAEVWNESHIV